MNNNTDKTIKNNPSPPPYGYDPQTGKPRYTPPYQLPPPPPVVKGSAFDTVFMVLSLIFSVFSIHAVFFAGFFKAGFTAAYVIWFIIANVYIFTKNKIKPSLYPLILGVMSLGASVVFTLYNDEVINLLLLAIIGFSSAEYFMLLTKQNRYSSKTVASLFDAAYYLFVSPFKFIKEPFRSAFASKDGKSSKAKEIIIGVAVAVPVAAVVIGLLISSDFAFQGLVSKIFSNIALTLVKLVLGVLVFPIMLSGAFAARHNLIKERRGKNDLSREGIKKIPPAALATVLGVVSLVYVVYLFSQLAYFFDAFKSILPEDYSASEYARRGFFEMCAICAINLIFISVVMLFGRNKSKKSDIVFKVFNTFIALFSLIIAASAFSKMYLYIDMYGLTRKRVLTSVFILLLSIVIISLIFRIFIKNFPYMKVIAVLCSLIVIAVGFMDIDRTVTKYNYELWQNKAVKSIDGGFMEELGDSAAPYIEKFEKSGDKKLQKDAQMWISTEWRKQNISDFDDEFKKEKSPSIFAFNLAKSQAEIIVDEYNKNYDFNTYWRYALGFESAKKVYKAPFPSQKSPDYCYEEYEYEDN